MLKFESRREEICSRTREILGDLKHLRKCDFQDFFPTDVERVARDLIEVEVRRVPWIDGGSESSVIAGLMDRPDGEILISDEFPHRSQRFTLAHEIGHWVLHRASLQYHRDRPMVTSSRERDSRPIEEVEADTFAAELLMPTDAVRNRFADKFGPAQVQLSSLSPGFLRRLSQYSGREIDPSLLGGNLRRLSLLLAEVRSQQTRADDSLVAVFDVSPSAMAIQLEECKLVTI